MREAQFVHTHTETLRPHVRTATNTLSEVQLSEFQTVFYLWCPILSAGHIPVRREVGMKVLAAQKQTRWVLVIEGTP